MTTLYDLADQLPNGFHDMGVRALALDFVRRTATFEVELSVGDPEASSPELRNRTRVATLVVEGLQYCVLEPPDPRYPFARPEPAWFVDLSAPDDSIKALGSLPPGTFAGRFFVNQWNAFVHIAGEHVSLSWVSDSSGG